MSIQGFCAWNKMVKLANTDADVFSLPSVVLKLARGYTHNRLPHTSCIYFVVNNQSEIIYIGASRDLKRRFQNHLTHNRCFWEEENTVFYLECELHGKNDPTEAAYIRKFQPVLNRKVA